MANQHNPKNVVKMQQDHNYSDIIIQLEQNNKH